MIVQLDDFLAHGAKTFSGKIALVCGDERLTYGELDQRASALAHLLIESGVRRGDRVIVYLDNRPEVAIGIFAVLRAGAVFSVIHPTTKPGQLAHLLDDSGAVALISHVERIAAVREATRSARALRTVLFSGAAPATTDPLVPRVVWIDEATRRSDVPPPRVCIDIDLAALVYTSGSTGVPKGVMLTHLNMVAAATSITTYLENTADDVILSCLPCSFDYGLYQLLMACRVGATLVMEKSFVYPHAILQRVVSEAVTGLPIVPTMSAILLQMDLSAYDFRTLRYVTNTAAALPVEHIQKLRRLLPSVRIYSMYGLTECKRVAYLPPEQIDLRPGSVGRAMPNVEAYLVDDAGRRLPFGETGELVVRGSNVMKGYWNMPAETDVMLRPGPLPGEKVLHTGDLFRTDADGFLYFVGRRDEMIKSRGEKVSPREIENTIYTLDSVAQVVVLGVPDAILGEAIVAFVVPANGTSLAPGVVRRHCAELLEDFKVPGRVEILGALPLKANGKVDRRALIESASTAKSPARTSSRRERRSGDAT